MHVVAGSILLCQGGTFAGVTTEASSKAAVATVAAQNALMQLHWHAGDAKGAQAPAEVRDHVLDLMEHSWVTRKFYSHENVEKLEPFVRGIFESGDGSGPWVLGHAHGIYKFEAIPAQGGEPAVYGTLLGCNAWAGMSNPNPNPNPNPPAN